MGRQCASWARCWWLPSCVTSLPSALQVLQLGCLLGAAVLCRARGHSGWSGGAPSLSAVRESGMFFRARLPSPKKHSLFTLAAIGKPPAPPAMKKYRYDWGASLEKHLDHPPCCVSWRDPTRMRGGWSCADHPPTQMPGQAWMWGVKGWDFRPADPNHHPHHPPRLLTRGHAIGNWAGGWLGDHPPGVRPRDGALVATTRHVRTSRRVVGRGPPARTTRAVNRWS
jgi:hypothetical protein